MQRQAGVVLPLFSMRTRRDWGIGQITDLPICAQWILRAGHRLLQVLPPHELSPGETSPYGALTAFGLDPIYIDVEAIRDLSAADIDAALGTEGRSDLTKAQGARNVEYGLVRALKLKVTRVAFDHFFEREWSQNTPRAKQLSEFIVREKTWLDDLSLYTALREAKGGWSWTTWSEDLRDRHPQAIQKARQDHARRLIEVAYLQWLLFGQWQEAHGRMRDLGVELMGDLPFIVGTESADVWSHAAQFQLHVSLGAPPDAYSADGQDWGLPAYDFLAMESTDLAWIRARTRRAAALYDRFRLDHVVGYFRQWIRPSGGKGRGRFDPDGSDAERARGRRVLGAILAEVSRDALQVSPPRVMAEDLGVIPPYVRESLGQMGLPGYRVLPWERDGATFRDPRSFPARSIASWSTHDTAPLPAWWKEFPEDDRKALLQRAHVPPDADEHVRSLALLNDLYGSGSDLALVLAQELLWVPDRINVPATVGGANWTWRLPMPIEDLEADASVAGRFDAIRALVAGSGRFRTPVAG
jgi:4-alpha-glucanotransferase